MCRILIAAGGSGGHLFPAKQLVSQLKDHECLVAGHNLSKNPFFQGNVRFQDIAASIPKNGNWFRFFFSTFKGFFQSVRLLWQFSPDVVVGFGSYHTFPVLLASTFFRKKIVLFEANCVLGKVNCFFAPFAKKIAIQFPLSKALKNGVFIPLLPWEKKEQTVCQLDARKFFGLSLDRFTILIFGGSQGAQFFNEMMPKVMVHFPQIQIIHCTGKGKALYSTSQACVKEFVEQMDLAYAAADMVICRSGAGTIGELIQYKKPSLLIPFPFATDQHQLKNGAFLADQVKGARLVEQKDASLEKIVDEINILQRDFLKFKSALENWKVENRMSLGEVCLGN
jgi:UDP-N-acetylglucosamine--N-acetylmuramyl-(pentapeptide) pyrophosphoryl-undecaprenol N-acetylglucosamine transferase